MSLLHLDFPSGQAGLYGTDSSYMLNGLYAETQGTTIIDDPDPTITGNVLHFAQSGTTGRVRRVLSTSGDVVGLAARVYLPSLPNSSLRQVRVFEWRNSDNETLLYLNIKTDGYLEVVNSAGTVLGTSSGPSIVTSAWQHVEARAVLSATVGEFEVRVEGVSKISLTGVNTVGSATPIICTQIAYTSIADNGSKTVASFKDLMIWDDAGSVNNNFIGSCAVYEIIPDGDVANTWGLSTGTTGYTLVDEAPPNDDTDYIYAASPAPAADKMSLTDLPADVTSVKGLIAIVRSKKTDGGDGNLQIGMISGASTGLGSDRPLTTAYTYWQDVFEVDPATGVAWTRIGVNAANIQFDRTL